MHRSESHTVLSLALKQQK
jgi:hypothetical protein